MEADPSVIYEWLCTKSIDLRFLQQAALDQMCNEILFSDNIDKFTKRFPPARFIPLLSNIFLDDEAPLMVLEANARAVSYYLDLSRNSCQLFVATPDLLPAVASHLLLLDMSCATSSEFGQQLIKLLKIVCENVQSLSGTESLLMPLLQFLCNHADNLHSDVRQAGLYTICRLFTWVKPEVVNSEVPLWIQSLAYLMECNESAVADQALQAFSNLSSRYAKCGADPTPLASPYIIDHLLRRLRIAGGVEGGSGNSSSNNSPAIVQAITNILIILCSCGSTVVLQVLLNSHIPLASTLAMVLQRSENPSVVLSILRLINIILILLYQSPDACNDDKRKSPHDGNQNNEVIPSTYPVKEQQGGEGDSSTTRAQMDDETVECPVAYAYKPQVQAPGDGAYGSPVSHETDGGAGEVNRAEESKVSYLEAQHGFVHQCFPILINLFNETACSAVKHQCILLAKQFATCLTPEGLEKISLTKFHSASLAFSLTQVIYSVCTEDSDEAVLHVLKLSQCLLLKAPHIYTVVFRRLGLKPLFDQLADIWGYLCDADAGKSNLPTLRITDLKANRSSDSALHHESEASPLTEPCLLVSERLSGKGNSVIRVWHNWYFVRIEEQICIFSNRAIILLQTSSRGVNENSERTANEATGLCALALHTGSGRKSMKGFPSCASVVLLPNRPLLHRPSLKAHLLQVHSHFLEKITEKQSDVEIVDLLPADPQSVTTVSPKSQSDNRLHRHTESVDCRPVVASPSSSHFTGTTGSGASASNSFLHLLSKAEMHLGLRRTPRPAYSPSPDTNKGGRSGLLQRQASSPARSCLPRNPCKSPSVAGEPLPIQLDTVSIGPFYFSVREAGTNGTCLCVQLRKYMNTKNTREALLFFEDDTLGFTRVRISPLQGVEHMERSRQLSQSERFTSQEGSANREDGNLYPTHHRRRYSISLVNILSELDKEFVSPSTAPALVDSGEPVSSSYPSSCYTDLFEPPVLFDLDILFGVNSATADAASEAAGSTSSEGACLAPSRRQRLNSEASQVVSELQRLRDLLFPSELVYETYSSGRLTLQLQPSTDNATTKRTCSTSTVDKTNQGGLRQSHQYAHKLTVRLCRFLSVPVESWQRQPRRHYRQGSEPPSELAAAPDPMLHLRQVVFDIAAAFQANGHRPPSSTLADLTAAYRRLAQLLTTDSDQTVTAYELMICGLVPALLLCLSASNAGRWKCQSKLCGLDPVTDLLWYLHERRRLFLHSQSTSAGHSGVATLSPLSNLIRGLVQAFELADHLPLCLHAKAPGKPPLPTDLKWIMPKSQSIGATASFSNPRQEDASRQEEEDQPTSSQRKSVSSWPLASLPVGVIKAAVASATAHRPQDKSQTDKDCSNNTDGQHTLADCPDGQEASALARVSMSLSYRLKGCYPVGMFQVDGRFTLQLKRLPPVVENGQSDLLTDNASPASIEASPLVTVGQLRRVLERMTLRQWYDQPRTSLPFYRQVESAGEQGVQFAAPLLNNGTSCPLELLGGVIDWLATNGGQLALHDWCNPAIIRLVSVAASAVRSKNLLPATVLGPRAGSLVDGYPVNCPGSGSVLMETPVPGQAGNSSGRATASGSGKIPAWLAIDLGLQLTPTAYSLAYLRRAELVNSTVAPRNWRLDASNDAVHWTLLSSHRDDSLQSISGSRSTWILEPLPEQERDAGETETLDGWRYFRIVATGANAHGNGDLGLGGLEFYGTIHAVHSEVMTPDELAHSITSEFVKTIQSQSPTTAKTKGVRRSQKGSGRTLPQRPTVGRSPDKDDPGQDSSNCAGGILESIEDDESVSQCLELFAQSDDQTPSSLHSVVSSKSTTDGAADGAVEEKADEHSGATQESRLNALEDQPSSGEAAKEEEEEEEEEEEVERAGEGSGSELVEMVAKGSNSEAVVGETRSETQGAQEQDARAPLPPPAPTGEEGDMAWLWRMGLTRIGFEPQQVASVDVLEDFGDAIEAIIESNLSSADLPTQPTADGSLKKRRYAESDGNATLLVASDSEVAAFDSAILFDPARSNTTLVEAKTSEGQPCSPSRGRQTPSGCQHQQSTVAAERQLPLPPLLSSSGTTAVPSKHSPGHVQLRRRPRRPRPYPLVVPVTSNSSSSGLETEPAMRSVSSASSNASTLTSATFGSDAAVTTAALVSQGAHRRPPLTWTEATRTLLLPPGLIPRFNPLGTNALATTPFVLPPCDYLDSRSTPLIEGDSLADHARGRLTLILMIMSASECVQQMPLLDNECTLFKYVQYLSDLVDPAEVTGRGEPSSDGRKGKPVQFSLRLGYREWHPDDAKLLTRLNHHLHSPHYKTGQRTFLSATDLRLTPSLRQPLRYANTCSAGPRVLLAIAEDDMASAAGGDCDVGPLDTDPSACHPETVLQLLSLLHQLSGASEPVRWPGVGHQSARLSEPSALSMSATVGPGDFVSPRLSNKLMRQLRDPLAVASGALPDWCLTLTRGLRSLFSFDVRLDFLRACAFGPARAVIWLQNLPVSVSFDTASTPSALSRETSNSRSSRLTAAVAALPRSFRELITSTLVASPGNNNDTISDGPQIEEIAKAITDVEIEYDDDDDDDDGNDEADADADHHQVISVINEGSAEADHHHQQQPSPALATGKSEAAGLPPQALPRDASDTESGLVASGLQMAGDVSISPAGPSGDTGVVGKDSPSRGTHKEQQGEAADRSPPGSRKAEGQNAGDSSDGSWLLDFAARLMERHSNRKSELGAQLFDEDEDEFPLDVISGLFLATRNQQLSGTSVNTSDVKLVIGRVGRLHKEFVRIPRLSQEVLDTESGMTRDDRFWQWAARLMDQHASEKSELEIQFIGEDGTGIGPTLEFYSLLLSELRRKGTQMWVSTDDDDLRPGGHAHSADVANSSSSGQQGVEIESVVVGATATTANSSYVNSAHGLFPAPWPVDSIPSHVLHRFYILGITIAKCLQDNRRIDLPLSMPFLKLLSVYGNIPYGRWHCYCPSPSPEHEPTTGTRQSGLPPSFSEAAKAERVFASIDVQSGESSSDNRLSGLAAFLLTPQYRRVRHSLTAAAAAAENSVSAPSYWSQDMLDLGDLCQIYPDRAYFFHQIMKFSGLKRLLHNPCDKLELEQLSRDVFGGSVDDLCLAMEFLPTSKSLKSCPLLERYPWEEGADLAFTASHLQKATTRSNPFDMQKHGVSVNAGADNDDDDDGEKRLEPEALTVHNIDVYLTRMLSFCLDKGIRRQLEAFRTGFERVLPLSWLSLFNASELSQLICGESLAHWTREDLLAYTIPSMGFTAQSPTYQMLINVLADFSVTERRAFLQFTTGCSSLPYGGLKNLHPRLRVVRKEVTDGSGGGSGGGGGAVALPSVNTCVHYLKLPEYQTEEELRTALLRANQEVGFYLN